MPDTQSSEMLPVEQCDRDAAEAYATEFERGDLWAEGLAQAFRNHRLNSTADLQRQVDEAREALGRIYSIAHDPVEVQGIAQGILADIKPG